MDSQSEQNNQFGDLMRRLSGMRNIGEIGGGEPLFIDIPDAGRFFIHSGFSHTADTYIYTTEHIDGEVAVISEDVFPYFQNRFKEELQTDKPLNFPRDSEDSKWLTSHPHKYESIFHAFSAYSPYESSKEHRNLHFIWDPRFLPLGVTEAVLQEGKSGSLMAAMRELVSSAVATHIGVLKRLKKHTYFTIRASDFGNPPYAKEIFDLALENIYGLKQEKQKSRYPMHFDYQAPIMTD